MSGRKSVLLLLSRVPVPCVSGEKIRSVNNIKALHKEYDLHIVAISDAAPAEEALDFLNSNSASCRIFVKSGVRSALRVFMSLVNGLPLQVNYFFFSDVRRYVREKARSVDLLFCSLIRTAEYGRGVDLPKILDFTDSIALNYKRSAESTHSYLWKLIYMMEFRRLLKYEKDAIASFDRGLFTNTREIEFLGGGDRAAWMPQGVDEALTERMFIKSSEKDTIVFFGKMDYPPNVDAVLWFCREVMPKLTKGLRLVIVGASPAKVIKELARDAENIEVTGFVKDPCDLIMSALCVVAPMRTGAGMQNKILEAMALGKIVVTSSLAASAIIGARDGEEFLISDLGNEMAVAVNGIYADPDRFSGIGVKAREFVRKNYTLGLYGTKLLSIVGETLEG